LELELKYGQLLTERDELLSAERKRQEEQLKELDRIRHLNHSAIIIQQWWRERQKKQLHEKKQVTNTYFIFNIGNCRKQETVNQEKKFNRGDEGIINRVSTIH
jgi:hypothetical protein